MIGSEKITGPVPDPQRGKYREGLFLVVLSFALNGKTQFHWMVAQWQSNFNDEDLKGVGEVFLGDERREHSDFQVEIVTIQPIDKQVPLRRGDRLYFLVLRNGKWVLESFESPITFPQTRSYRISIKHDPIVDKEIDATREDLQRRIVQVYGMCSVEEYDSLVCLGWSSSCVDIEPHYRTYIAGLNFVIT